MGDQPKRNQNFMEGLWGYSSTDGETPVEIYVDPVTHRLYVNTTGGGGGGTEYTEGDVDATPTGSVVFWRRSSDDAQLSASDENPFPVDMISNLEVLSSGIEKDSIGVSPFRRADAFQATINSTDATSATTVKAATTSKSTYVTDLLISSDISMNVKFQDNAGTPVVLIEKLYIAPYRPVPVHFETPIKVANGNNFNAIANVAGNLTIFAQGYVI